MINRKVGVLSLASLLAVLAMLVLAVIVLYNERVIDERRNDLEAVARVCTLATNVLTNEHLLELVQASGVRLKSPIPKDPAKPCFRLVTPWNSRDAVTNPGVILIIEVNIRDDRHAFAALMDGSVQFLNRNRLPPNQDGIQ